MNNIIDDILKRLTKEMTKNEFKVYIDRLIDESYPEFDLEPGDLLTISYLPGVHMELREFTTLTEGKLHILYSFYDRDIRIIKHWWLEGVIKKIGHTDPKSIFKEDVNYGVQEN